MFIKFSIFPCGLEKYESCLKRENLQIIIKNYFVKDMKMN